MGKSCVVFTGIYEHTIDSKNRLAIPSDIRKRLRSVVEGSDRDDEVVSLYVTPDESRRALCLWPKDRFEQRAAELDRSERSSREILPYERLFYSLANLAELDKQGRIRLPDTLLSMCAIGSEVTVLGVNDHMEVWNRQAWTQYMARMLDEHPEVLMHPRQAMRRDPD